MRVRLRSPTPDWLCTGEDVPGPLLGSSSEEREQVAVPNKSTERSRRHRALKGGGRKEGKQKLLRRKRDILGQRSNTHSSFALRSAEREASLTTAQTLREKAEVDGLLTYLGYFDPHPGRPPTAQDTRHSFVRRYILEQLARVMAAEEGVVCGKRSTRANPAYFARRLVAGWGQILDLWEAGEEDALGRAHEEGALILRGARFNAAGMRDRLSMYEPAGRTRSGRQFSAYQPETIEAPIDYARLLKYAVEVQLSPDEPISEGADHGNLHRESPPSSEPLRSPSPSRRSTVFVVPLDDLIGEIAAAEVASDLGAGLKRKAGGSDDAGNGAESAPSQKKRKKSAVQKQKSKVAAKLRKKATAAAASASGELPRRRPGFAKHGVDVDVEEPAVKIAAHAFRVDRWGYGAINDGSLKDVPWTAQDLDAEGVRYIRWDGRTTKVILDAKRRIVAVLLARPRETPGPDGKTSWTCAMERLAALFERIRSEHAGDWKGEDYNGRRGEFTSFGFGSSYGGGQSLPGSLQKDGWEADVERELRNNEDLQRLARWGSGESYIFTLPSSCSLSKEGFASFFPKAYAFANDVMKRLFARGEATRTMPGSVYAASTCNLGPRTVCLDHTDHLNYPGIPCVITGFGDYDPDEGGDLFLLNFGLRIRFPPGSTAILSSAGVRHGNTPVPQGQTRYSYTQYTAGGLVRWVALGHQKATGMSSAYRSKFYGPPGSDWKEQLSRLSIYEELPADRAALAAYSEA
ncbi:unnamed protein product [Peniophora sp. CBMAI 1063]|nr:unnamed protein product [Peniophora sp. CBMAI 1063]